MTEQKTPTSEVLNRAAELIEERGWADRNVDSEEAWGEYSDTSPICLEGGILAAVGADKYTIGGLRRCPAYRAVHAYLDFPENRPLYVYNDAIGRSASEVIKVLRATAVIEQAREAELAGASA